jgi:hypothetical protein
MKVYVITDDFSGDEYGEVLGVKSSEEEAIKATHGRKMKYWEFEMDTPI